MLTKSDLQAIQKIIDESINKRVTPLEKKMESGFRRLHKADGEILDYLEKEDRQIKNRVEKLERHAGFPVVN